VAKDDAVVLEVRVSDNPLASREAAHPWLMMFLKLPDAVRAPDAPRGCLRRAARSWPLLEAAPVW
jgi:hypothetical protein